MYFPYFHSFAPQKSYKVNNFWLVEARHQNVPLKRKKCHLSELLGCFLAWVLSSNILTYRQIIHARELGTIQKLCNHLRGRGRVLPTFIFQGVFPKNNYNFFKIFPNFFKILPIFSRFFSMFFQFIQDFARRVNMLIRFWVPLQDPQTS